ncbi:MAG TPA: fibronectin type III domain-containing protein [Pyrinomonadaceae bacterium]|nr:fibronectin type III domain-containing protein [Pyrinomonadaceae bacterium]
MTRHPHHTVRVTRSLRGRLILASLVVTAAALLATLAGSAADPASGTLSPATPTLTYTGGPNLVSNPSGQAGDVDCVNLPCDDFALTINVPAGYENTHQVRIVVSWPIPAEDYDLQVTGIGSSGNTPGTPEVVVGPAVSGSHTVRVIPFLVAGGTFTTTITLEPKPAAPPGGGSVTTGTSPRFETYTPPADSGLGTSAGEPSIGFGKPSAQFPGGRAMFIAALETLRVSFDDCSSPAKDTWEDVSSTTTSVATLDPILESDRDATGRTFVSQLGPKTSFLAFTDDDGETWTPSQGSPINPGVDHQTIGVGPFDGNLPDGIGSYPNAVYYASQDAAIAQMGISRDGGLTFGPAVPMYNLTQCGGLHGHIEVGPDGAVYVPNKSCTPGAVGVEGGGAQGFVVSEDEGTTFTIRTVPGSVSGNNDPSVGIGRGDEVAGGRIYFGYVESGRPKIAVSDDKGVTWTTPLDVGAPFSIRNSVFPQVAAGDDDRAAFMFIGTPTGGDYQDTANFDGEWHMYIATTYDGGQTWTTVDTTPNDPVQLGSICTKGTTCGADRNLLDFNDLRMDYEGRIVGAYADGCVGCTSPETSRSALATIVRQSGGKRLLAQFDPPENGKPLAPRVDSVTRTSGGVRLEWSAPDNGGSPITGYKVYRRTSAFGLYSLLITTNKTTYEDTTADAGVNYFYKVTAVNANGEGPFCGSHQVSAAPPTEDPCLAPGVTVLRDPEGDGSLPVGTPVGANDILSVSVSEPYAVGDGKLVFTIRMRDLQSPLPPSSRWPVQFQAPNSTNYVVAMKTDAAGMVSFAYGEGTTGTDPTTPADPLSTYSPEGYITIVVPRSGVGSPAVGQQLTGFLMRQTVGAVTPDNAPDNLGPAGSYTIVGNAFCRPNAAPLAALKATPSQGTEPLAVKLDASGSSDPDTDAPADTIASYTFDFGDGSPTVTQASAVIMHTYQAGNYRAEVRVTDSRGKQSENVAGVNIEVSAANKKPLAPTNLFGVPSASGRQVTLRWDDNSNNETGFRIERCLGAGCLGFVQVATAKANATGYINSGLTPNSYYRYRVRAFNTAGLSRISNVITVDTTVRPLAPSNLTGTAATNGQQATLHWDDNAGNETGFKIERCEGANCNNFEQVGTARANATSFVSTGLSPNSIFRFRVRASNRADDSAYSNIAKVDTTIKPLAPSGLTAVSNASGTRATLHWTDNSNNEKGFKVERCLGAGCTNFQQVGTASAGATGFSNTGLTPHTTYRFRVRAYNTAGDSAYSKIATVTTN